MKVIIDVPTKEFGIEIEDKFQDFFKRVRNEIKATLITNFNIACRAYELETVDMFLSAFKKMQIIQDNATNGDVIKEIFPDAQIDYNEKSDLVDEYVTVFLKDCDTCQDYSYDWWSAPYNKEVDK